MMWMVMVLILNSQGQGTGDEGQGTAEGMKNEEGRMLDLIPFLFSLTFSRRGR